MTVLLNRRVSVSLSPIGLQTLRQPFQKSLPRKRVEILIVSGLFRVLFALLLVQFNVSLMKL